MAQVANAEDLILFINTGSLSGFPRSFLPRHVSVPQYRWEGSMNYQDAGDSSVIVELTAVAEGVPLPSCSLENSEYSWCKTPKWCAFQTMLLFRCAIFTLFISSHCFVLEAELPYFHPLRPSHFHSFM